MNVTQVSDTSTNSTKPVDGYGGSSTDPLTAVGHLYDDPALRVYQFCKANDKIMTVCHLYDSRSPNITLIGVEYMIDCKIYKILPDKKSGIGIITKRDFSRPSQPNIPLSK
jgi:hypothetical protein